MNKPKESIRQNKTVIPFQIDGEFFFKKGIKAYRNNEFERAIKLLKRAHELEPEEPMVLCQLAAVLSEVGQFQLSNEYLKIVVEELDTEMVECYYFIANNFAHLGLFHEAKRNAIKYMDAAPGGEFFEDTEDLLEMLSFEVDSVDDDDDLLFLQDLAKDLMDSKRYQEAIEILHELLEGYPQFWAGYNSLALAHFYLGEVDKSVLILNEILQKNPGNLHAMCNQLVIYYYLRLEGKVEELVNQLMVVHPILIEHRFKLGATFAMVGRYDLALPLLLSLKRTGFDGDATFYYWLCYSAYYCNQEQLAQSSWARVLSLQPDREGMAPWEQREDLSVSVQTKEEELLYLYLQMKIQASHESIEDKDLKDCFEIADLLFNRFKHEEVHLGKILTKWFVIFSRLSNFQFRNKAAVAAAIEYNYLQAEGRKLTKTAISNAYQISTSTASKYIQLYSPFFVGLL